MNLAQNLCGKDYETIDFRNKIFRLIYKEIFPKQEHRLIRTFEDLDPYNDGKLEPKSMKIALGKLTSGSSEINEDVLDKFIKFLDKEPSGKIDYMKWINKLTEISNREHNPFKSIVQRLKFFLDQNK